MKNLTTKLPPLKSLVAFEAVVRLKTVTAAAKELASTQPAVTQHIRQIERDLNTQLFVKKGRLLYPTESALKFYRITQKALEDIAYSSETMRTNGHEKASVTFICSSGIAELWLLPRLKTIQTKFSDLAIHVRTSDQNIVPSENNIVIEFGKLHANKNLVTLFTETVFPIASSTYAKQHKLDINSTLEELLKHPLIRLSSNNNRWLSWPQWLQQINKNLRPLEMPTVIHGNYHAVISAALNNQGLALAWENVTEDLIDKDLIKPITSLSVSRNNYGCFINTQLISDTRTLALVDYLKTIATDKHTIS